MYLCDFINALAMVHYHSLTSALNLTGTTVVVIGGTQGIRAGIAVIMGHDQTVADAVAR